MLSKRMKIGLWIVCEWDGDLLREGYYNEDAEALAFQTKRDALKEIALWTCDTAPKPKVERTCSGAYVYQPRNEDGEYTRYFWVEKLTPENIAEYTDIANHTGDFAR